MPRSTTRRLMLCLGAFALLSSVHSGAQSTESLAARIDKIISRPEFAHANFGIEFYALDTGQVIYALNANKLFVPASTTKLLTEGTLLARLGPDFRFHTKIYRTGPIDARGRLKGDLVLLAAGDPNLSNRMQPDGTLAFVDEDHSEGGPAVAGDPLAVIRELAQSVYAKGVRRIEGRVIVDTALFPDSPRQGGDAALSSIMVNDNVIDLVVNPGAGVGAPVMVQASPQTSYAQFVNKLTTTAAGSKATVDDPQIVSNPDGTATITLSGGIPVGAAAQTFPVAVPSPTAFATRVLEESLRAAGIVVSTAHPDLQPHAPGAAAHEYSDANLVAEHISAPLSEDVKVTLKVSQNLHAGVGQYLLGAYVARDTKNPFKAGFGVEHAFLEEAHLDLTGASQGDGDGGDWADLFSPDFMCSYLIYWSKRPEFEAFFHALPILGRDGTVAKIQIQSPGAGHVFAKTGTYGSDDLLNGKLMLNAKGLAGYVFTQSGRKLVFAAYVNHVHLPADPAAPQAVAGQALGAIAAAAYDAELPAGL